MYNCAVEGGRTAASAQQGDGPGPHHSSAIVNGKSVASCSHGGTANAYLDTAAYNSFTNCMQAFEACNNIFYINKGVVSRYTPIGTGGGRCYTDDRLRPDFTGSADL